jgi:hypothetical protein
MSGFAEKNKKGVLCACIARGESKEEMKKLSKTPLTLRWHLAHRNIHKEQRKMEQFVARVKESGLIFHETDQRFNKKASVLCSHRCCDRLVSAHSSGENRGNGLYLRLPSFPHQGK